jgi:hypothetical protein
MITITHADFLKLIKLLEKEQQTGAHLKLRINQTTLEIITMDKSNKEMKVELSDKDYPFMPKITKTETF